MPLSEHEQKILAELEESLSQEDPRFAKSVRETNVYSLGLRRVRWGVVGFLAGLATMVVFFTQVLLLGFIGVVVMFASAVVVERNLRRLGRASWRDITRPGAGDDAARTSGPLQGIRDWVANRRNRRR